MLDQIEKYFSITGNFVTIIIGIVAYSKRDRISLIFRYLQFSYFSERTKRLNETLGKLEALDYNDKNSRAEILALFGQISGQLTALEQTQPSLATIQSEISSILNKTLKLSEPTKRRILHSIHSAMDDASFNNLSKISKSIP